jgi:Domain of Unknown Function (DUF1080)
MKLFDGRSLSGWHAANDAIWTVENGALVGGASTDGWLRSDRTYRDFVLWIEFLNSAGRNGGVFFRASRESKAGDPPNPAEGYKLQIYNEDSRWATGSVEDVIQRGVAVSPAPGKWHTYVLTVQVERISATLDGQKALDGRDGRYKAGYLGLQHHKSMRIEFRNIQIKPL